MLPTGSFSLSFFSNFLRLFLTFLTFYLCLSIQSSFFISQLLLCLNIYFLSVSLFRKKLFFQSRTTISHLSLTLVDWLYLLLVYTTITHISHTWKSDSRLVINTPILTYTYTHTNPPILTYTHTYPDMLTYAQTPSLCQWCWISKIKSTCQLSNKEDQLRSFVNRKSLKMKCQS